MEELERMVFIIPSTMIDSSILTIVIISIWNEPREMFIGIVIMVARQERGNLPDNTAVLFKKRTLLPVLMTYENVDFTGYLYCFLRWQQRILKNKIRKKIMY